MAEAAALMQREAGAQRPGGGRVAAQKSVEQGEAGAGGEQRIALPCPAARPRPGSESPPAAERLRASVDFVAVRLAPRASPKRRGNALAGVGGVVGRRGSGRRESPGHGESLAALCHLYLRVIRPACRGVAMSDKLALSDMIRDRPGRHAKSREIRP